MTPSRDELVFLVAEALCDHVDGGPYGWSESETGSSFSVSATAAAEIALDVLLPLLGAEPPARHELRAVPPQRQGSRGLSVPH